MRSHVQLVGWRGGAESAGMESSGLVKLYKALCVCDMVWSSKELCLLLLRMGRIYLGSL